jgi:antitoxin PrlF
MAKKKVDECCSNCCRVEAIVSVDERGQMVLPKGVRDKIGIKAGDKLSLVSLSCGEALKCLALVRADDLSRMAEEFLGPFLKETPVGKK